MPLPEVLYHYCGTESFMSMMRSRSLWLSSLSLANDSMEGRLVNSTILRLAERDGLDLAARNALRDSVALMERFFDGLGFCLSESGDVLSQWRGYADDARGLAIGFSSAYLTQLGKLYHAQASPSFSLYKVKYEPDEQEALVEANYSELRKLIDAGAFKVRGSWSLLDNRTPEQIAQQDAQIEQANKKLMLKVVELFPKLYELKSPAFREEQEWRLVSYLVDARHDSCEFRAARGRIVPYRAFEMKATGTQPIVEVIIGPKHETPPEVVESLLRQAGHTNATVRRSSATYR